MILKASERGYAANLATHLMNAQDNEHVELHELRGFVAGDLHGAFKEVDAISRGTRCKNFLFSLSLSPPQQESVPAEVFEAAIEQIEQRLGLKDQPRAIVFHEKEGRRHAHAVWSRIDAIEMKAINLPHFKRKLNDIARELYLEQNWDLPNGFRKDQTRDPLTFTLAEWQQAKRTGRDPKLIKAQVRSAWERSDTGEAFTQALRHQGLFLARGDRRGFVLVDLKGEIYSLSRTSGAKVKELKARLGDPEKLPSVDQQKGWLAERMSEQLKAHVRELEEKHKKKGLALEHTRADMIARHRSLRAALKDKQIARWQAEERKRAARLPRGLKGLWSWISGGLKKIRLRNAHEVAQAERRDRAEREALITAQLKERRKLQAMILSRRAKQEKELSALHRDLSEYLILGERAQPERSTYQTRESARRKRPGRSKAKLSRDRSREGPEHEL